jgi:hypothetical protein
MGVREERAARKNTPGWVHHCETVGHPVWTVQGAACAFCGAVLRVLDRG